eukprot:TRINITY_DN12276_c0_g1_i3.p2 TRINITY_DN12276_c0_g1~~TRINITY_DN12276_c0_g1_i3.p2  ORF type:complete len:103 (+),score=17.58 TRINITY_DN12276_c0_g1_i3:669-977(+)
METTFLKVAYETLILALVGAQVEAAFLEVAYQTLILAPLAALMEVAFLEVFYASQLPARPKYRMVSPFAVKALAEQASTTSAAFSSFPVQFLESFYLAQVLK